MIPKNMFFIWLGSEPPKFMINGIRAFKELNPEFKIMTYFIKDITKTKNEDVKALLKKIKNPKSIFYKIYNRKWSLNLIKRGKSGYYAAISDCLRFYLLNKYGGIYLDCDTYPIKPFDDEFMCYPSIQIKISDTKYDSFFIASEPNFLAKDNYNKLLFEDGINIPRLVNGLILNYPDRPKSWSKKQTKLREKYFTRTLTIGEKLYDDFEYYYIDHYYITSWK